MKLHQQVILESRGPGLVKLILAEIIKAGKATNPIHILTLGRMSEFFKNGLKSTDLQLENPIDFESKATSSELVDYLKNMKPEDQVNLAQYLLDSIEAGEVLLKTGHSKVVDWINYVLRRQD
jgi:hypothetical protein